MIIKKYVVSTYEEVEEKIWNDLGPNAIILTSKPLRSNALKSLFFKAKIEVIAAVDEDDPYFIKKGKVNVKSQEWESPKESLEVPSANVILNAETGIKEPGVYQPSDIPGTYLDPRFNRKQLRGEASGLSYFKGRAFPLKKEEFNKTARGLIDAFSNLKKESAQDVKKTSPFQLKDFYQEAMLFLLSKGFSYEIAFSLVDKVIKKRGENIVAESNYPELFAKDIKSMIEVSGPICLNTNLPTIILFLGEKNVGKSTAIQGIALQYKKELNKRILVVSRNHNEELKKLGIAFSSELLKELPEPYDFIFIEVDISEEADRLADLSSGSYQAYLIAHSGESEEAILSQISKVPFNMKGLIFSKLDEAVKLGMLINIPAMTNIPITYILSHKTVYIAEPDIIANAVLEKQHMS